MISMTSSLDHSFKKKNLLTIYLIIVSILTNVLTDNIPDWNYKKHGTDWADLSGSLCDQALNNQAPLNLNSSKSKLMDKEKFFFADSKYNLSAKFQWEDQDNNLVLNFENDISVIHANFFQVEIENKDTGKKEKIDTYYNIGCRQIYFRIPGEHKINEQIFDIELQFNCTAKISDIIHGQSTESIFNFFVAYPININPEGSQSQFFQDIYNKGDVTLNRSFRISSVDTIMNNYIMFNRVFFYRGSKNFYDCMIDFYWLVVENKDIKINIETYEKVKSLINKTQAPDGNNRLSSDASDTEVFLIDNNFFP